MSIKRLTSQRASYFSAGEGEAAPPAGPTYLIQDNFTDTDNTFIDSHTPDIDTVGAGWQVAEGSWWIKSNTLEKRFNASSNQTIYIDSGSANVQVESIVYTGDGSWNGGVTVRYQDASNYWVLYWNASSGTLGLYERNFGLWTTRAFTTKTMTTSTEFTMKLTCDGTNIEGFVDDVSQVTYSSSFLQTQTNVGVLQYTNATSNYFDQFTVTDLS